MWAVVRVASHRRAVNPRLARGATKRRGGAYALVVGEYVLWVLVGAGCKEVAVPDKEKMRRANVDIVKRGGKKSKGRDQSAPHDKDGHRRRSHSQLPRK